MNTERMKPASTSWRARAAWRVAALAFASALLAAPAAGQGRQRVMVGENAPIALFWPDFIAQKKGFYAREGLEAETVFSGGSAASIQQLVGGSLDVVFASCAVPIYAIDKSAPITIIAETMAKWPYSIMVAREVTRAADMKGRKLMLAGPNDPTTIFWRRWLASQGVKPAEVDELFDAATPNRYAALANKAVAGALVTQPFDLRARVEGYSALVDFSAGNKDYSFVCVAVRKNWLSENPGRAKAFMRAIVASIAWWYEPGNRDEAVRILADTSKQDIVLARQTYDYFIKVQPFNRDAAISLSAMRNLVELLIETKGLPPGRTANDFVDPAYLPR